MRKQKWIWHGELVSVVDGETALVRLDTGFRTTREIRLIVVGRGGEVFSVPGNERSSHQATLYAKQLLKPGDPVVVETFSFEQRLHRGDESYHGTIWHADGYSDGAGDSWAEQMAQAGRGMLGLPF